LTPITALVPLRGDRAGPHARTVRYPTPTPVPTGPDRPPAATVNCQTGEPDRIQPCLRWFKRLGENPWLTNCDLHLTFMSPAMPTCLQHRTMYVCATVGWVPILLLAPLATFICSFSLRRFALNHCPLLHDTSTHHHYAFGSITRPDLHFRTGDLRYRVVPVVPPGLRRGRAFAVGTVGCYLRQTTGTLVDVPERVTRRRGELRRT